MSRVTLSVPFLLLVLLLLPPTAFFMGGGPELTQDAVVYSSRDRQRLRTEASGTVHIKLGVVLRNFDKFGVELS